MNLKKNVFSAIVILFVVGVYLWMQSIAWGICFKSSYYAQNVRDAKGVWHVIGFLFFAASVVWTYLSVKESDKVAKDEGWNAFIILLFMVASIAAYAGFIFNHA